MSAVTIVSPAGARAALIPDPSQPLAAVNLRLSTGSRHDPEGMSGLAHVLEHLMFARTRRHGRGGHYRLIESAGGYVNAKTSADWTKYLHGVSPDLLDMVLELETERFTDTVAMADDTDVDTERKVVLQERSQRMQAVAYGTAVEQLVAHLFPPTSGYHHLPVGTPAGVQDLGVEDCRRFFAEHYVAPRVNLSIVGSFDPDRIGDRVAGLLAVFARGEAAPATAGATTAPPTSRTEIRSSARPKIYLGYLLPPEGSREFELARLAAFYIGRGIAALLPDSLVRQQGLASSVSVKTMGRACDSSVGTIEMTPAPGVAPDDLVAALDTVLHEAAQAGPQPAGLQRARAIYRSGRLADDDSFMSRSDAVSLSMQLWGSAEHYMRHDAVIDAAGLSDLQSGLQLWHQPQRRAELVYTR